MTIMHTYPDPLHTLPESYFARDTAAVARDLLGKILVRRIGDTVCGGRIVETEAYLGAHDPGSHAATRGVTKRNVVMYGPPGRAYVYLTYGNHHMLNLVTESEGVAGAVLIRALEPLWGIQDMLHRRESRSGRVPRTIDAANGPGKLAAALGVGLEENGRALDAATLAVYDASDPVERTLSSGRVGLSAGHDLELRFYLEGNPFVSRGRTGAKPPRVRREDGTT
jgi:DNA-3-methyladenine glycosylase